MDVIRDRPPWPVLAAAVAAVAVGALDAIDSILAYIGPEGTGRIVGTLLRDALLVIAAVFSLRREAWARWTLFALFALTSLRLFSADEWIELAGIGFAFVGLGLCLAPKATEWFARPARV